MLPSDFIHALQQAAGSDNVLTDPADRITTANLFPVIDDLSLMQDYMHDNMNILQRKIDLEQFVDTSFAKAAGAT